MKPKQGMDTHPVTGLKALGESILGSLAIAAFVASVAVPVAAQDRAEISIFGGYTVSEGVNVQRVDNGAEFIDRVNSPGGFALGAAVHFWLNESVQLGAQYARQSSGLDLEGSSKRELTSMTINNYHGIFTFHGGTSRSAVRPYFLFGLGATHFMPSDFEQPLIEPPLASVESEVKFSGTLGGGVKFYRTEKIGFNLGARWTPTYIKSDPGGIYCSPYWPPYWGPSCWVLQDTDYANQFEFSAGIIFRL